MHICTQSFFVYFGNLFYSLHFKWLFSYLPEKFHKIKSIFLHEHSLQVSFFGNLDWLGPYSFTPDLNFIELLVKTGYVFNF